ncbi:hypothetical protein [Anaeroselena agilis]|uniref:Uncharacterized protein n=1 Tax=Anaeroselena agilis TaxID=3063788 RepID=A0ABU3NUF4_9FIRM|nr:hypothetical protein [Selenomonadales bacterium 4137-cl]
MARTPTQRKHRRQQLRRKYKRYAAAVAGAAILTGAALPGIPAAKALAAERPTNLTPQKTVQTAALAKDASTSANQTAVEKMLREKRLRLRGWHEHRHSWPGSDENQIRYENGRVYYRSDNHRDRGDYVRDLGSPVDLVKDRAAMYGLDRYRDSFTLISLSGGEAVVQVTKHDNGRIFNFILDSDYDGNWQIVDIRAR